MGLGPSPATVNGWLEATFMGVPYVVTSVWLELHTGDPGTGGAANIAPTDARQVAAFTRPANWIVQTTGAPAQYVISSDCVITHGSLHTELEDGVWVWNLIARSPISVVEGDVLILGEGMEFRIDGGTA